ncbi:FAD/NAD(P)-binding oxidoreductase family protein isoform X2 [Tasmannia lanceolata]|uniref:FAD/NAD(P)-binding oxidoreductase family protein isoform X2 n=1 Tax=Tasmannia lanceolata TaxID=3420 RepID=UPI0040630790
MSILSFGSSLVNQPIKPSNPISTTMPKTLIRTLIVRAESKPNKPNKRNAMEANKPTTRKPRKNSYGSSRRSALKKTFSQEQLFFTTPISSDPVVGIIGGGISGLICALYLEKRGVRSTVFDTGVHGLGGRMGTRFVDSERLIFDHAAQFFTVSDSHVLELVDGWVEKGLVREWRGLIGELEAGGYFVPIPSSSKRYIGVNGMRPVADSILSQTSMVNVVRPCWISKLEPFNGTWHLSENGKPCGQFDAIVIAHNAFDDPLPLPDSVAKTPFEGAFVKGVDTISWMANNTKKLFPFQSNRPHCWTFFSTASYGKQNKVPQENIPSITAQKVKAGMIEGVEMALGLPKGSLQNPFYTRVQLWGAALPTNTPGIPCIFDPHGRAGICGDWLLGSSVEAAAISGMALANHIADYMQSGGSRPDEFAVGLHNEFQPVDGCDIGQFPGLGSKEQVTDTQTCKTYT